MLDKVIEEKVFLLRNYYTKCARVSYYSTEDISYGLRERSQRAG